MAGINPSIVPLVYVRELVILQAAVDAAKSIEAGFRIIQRNGQGPILSCNNQQKIGWKY